MSLTTLHTAHFGKMAVFIAWLAPAVACAPRSAPSPSVPPSIPLPSNTTPIPIPDRDLRTFRYRSGSYRYDVNQTSVITVSQDTITPVTDTLVTAAQVSYVFEPSDSSLIVLPPIAVTVDSLRIRSRRDTSATMSSSSPILFTIPQRDSTPAMISDSLARSVEPSCDRLDDTAIDLAQGLLLQPRRTLTRGDRWADSSSTIRCRGGVSLNVATSSIFEVEDIRSSASGRIATVLRTSTVGVSGSTAAGAHSLRVEGSGDSQTSFLLDIQSGQLLEVNGQSSLALNFETSQSMNRVVQRSQLRARLVSPARH